MVAVYNPSHVDAPFVGGKMVGRWRGDRERVARAIVSPSMLPLNMKVSQDVP